MQSDPICIKSVESLRGGKKTRWKRVQKACMRIEKRNIVCRISVWSVDVLSTRKK